MLTVDVGPVWCFILPLSVIYTGGDYSSAPSEVHGTNTRIYFPVPSTWFYPETDGLFTRNFNYGEPEDSRYEFAHDPGFHNILSRMFPKVSLSPAEISKLKSDSHVDHVQTTGRVTVFKLPADIVAEGEDLVKDGILYVHYTNLTTFAPIYDGSGDVTASWHNSFPFGGVNAGVGPFPLETFMRKTVDGFELGWRYSFIYQWSEAWRVNEYRITYRWNLGVTGSVPTGTSCRFQQEVESIIWADDKLYTNPVKPYGPLGPRTYRLSRSTAYDLKDLDSLFLDDASYDTDTVANIINLVAIRDQKFLRNLEDISSFSLMSEVLDELEPNSLRMTETIYELIDLIISLRNFDPSVVQDLLRRDSYRRVVQGFRNMKNIRELAMLLLGISRHAAGEYIGYIFGIAPTKQEFLKARKVLRVFMETNSEGRSVRSYTKPVEDKSVFVSQRTYVRARPRAAFYGWFFTAERIGIIPLLSGAYSMVPFSWAFDWFYSLGDALSDIDAYFVRARAWDLTYRVTSITYTIPFLPDLPGYHITSDAYSSDYRRRVTRYWPVPFDSKMDEAPFHGFSRVRWATVGALISAEEFK